MRPAALQSLVMKSGQHLFEILYNNFRSYLSYSLIKISSFRTFVVPVLHEKSIAELKILGLLRRHLMLDVDHAHLHDVLDDQDFVRDDLLG